MKVYKCSVGNKEKFFFTYLFFLAYIYKHYLYYLGISFKTIIKCVDQIECVGIKHMNSRVNVLTKTLNIMLLNSLY